MTTCRLPFLGFIISFQLLVCAAGFGATHTLTINTNGNGTVGRNPTNSVYPNGSVVTLTALPAAGWLFSSWSGDASGTNNPLNVSMDADKVIAANFSQIPNYTLAVNISGNGSVNPPGGSFLSNTVVSLTATPSNGWVFGSWSGAASGNANPLNLPMNSNKSITATFVQPPSISSQPSGGSVNIGSSFSFSVTATGSAPLAYQWLFDSVALSNATAATLTLTNIQPGTGGNYQVVVSNPYGSTTSVVAVLIVDCTGTNVVSVASDAALRAAMSIGGNVRFCFSGTVTLTNTIDVNKDVTLDASGTSVTVNGGDAVRLFNVSTGVSFTITNVMLVNGLRLGTNGASAGASPAQHGESVKGGAIYNAGGTVRLVSCVLSNNAAQGGNGGSGNSATANGAGGHAAGGAVHNLGGSLILQDSVFVSNTARGGGGGTYLDPIGGGGTGYGTGGSANGGAVCNDGGTVTVIGSMFTSNVALAAAGAVAPRPIAYGGAIFQSAGSCELSNTIFIFNRAQGAATVGSGTRPFNNGASAAGGAVAVTGGVMVVRLASFGLNGALGGDAYRASGCGEALGGAIYNSARMEIRNSNLSSNTARPGAGGFYVLASGWGGAIFNAAALEVTSSVLDENVVYGTAATCYAGTGSPSSAAFGGALCNVLMASFYGTNCTFVLNHAIGGPPCSGGSSAGGAYGGGIYNEGAMFTLVNGTIASNTVSVTPNSYQGGPAAGANIANTNGTVLLRNSLLAYPGTNANVWGTITDGGYNMCSDGSANFSSGSSFNFTDPKLLPLANNGGPTLTMALAPNSPALDWAPALDAPATDQRGFHRPFGDGVDLGAFEAGPPVSPLIGRRNGSALDLSFYGQAGFSYRIERSADFLTWELQEATGILTMNGLVLRTIPMTGSKLFFRLSLDF